MSLRRVACKKEISGSLLAPLLDQGSRHQKGVGLSDQQLCKLGLCPVIVQAFLRKLIG